MEQAVEDRRGERFLPKQLGPLRDPLAVSISATDYLLVEGERARADLAEFVGQRAEHLREGHRVLGGIPATRAGHPRSQRAMSLPPSTERASISEWSWYG